MRVKTGFSAADVDGFLCDASCDADNSCVTFRDASCDELASIMNSAGENGLPIIGGDGV